MPWRNAKTIKVPKTIRAAIPPIHNAELSLGSIPRGRLSWRPIAAYRAWLPLEEIRPEDIAQWQWEEKYAWPADGKPPYPPLVYRVVLVIVIYLTVALIIVLLLQAFTPFPALTWLGNYVRTLVLGN